MADRTRGFSRSGPGRPRLVLGLGTVLAPLLLGACSMDIIGGGGPEVSDRFKLTVTVTNTGNGFGRVKVAFPAGTVQTPCPDVLGPGESCSPFVQRAVPTTSADIEVSAVAGSRFVGWGGAHCTGTDGECTVGTLSNDPDIEIGVEARFDLVDGS